MTRDPVLRPRPGDQCRALARVFFIRFFDNDLTGGSSDLRATFFWLVGFLMAPGFLLPFLSMQEWEVVGRFKGPAALRAQAMSSKLLYLYFSMTASALLASLTWNNLLLNRLDALVLGAAPVRRSTIVAAKIAALFGYLACLAFAMHGFSAITFSVTLSAGSPPTFILRGITAHLMAGVVASTLVFAFVISVQGVLLAVGGPRVFQKASSVLQVVLVSASVVSVTFLPFVVQEARGVVEGTGPAKWQWLLWTPPFWSLGTYEWMLGTGSTVLSELHVRATTGLAVLVALTLASYYFAYERLARSVVEGAGATGLSSLAAGGAEWVVRRSTHIGAARAAMQMLFSSLLRVDRLRFTCAIASGVAVGLSMPALAYWMVEAGPRSRPSVAMNALSLAVTALVTAGLRVAIAIPSDLGASWLVPAAAPSVREIRSGTWRAMFIIGIMPLALVSASIYTFLWGAVVAAVHLVTLVCAGGLLVEILLWNHDAMPHTEPWRPDRAGMGKRWPLYAGGFVAFTIGVATLEAASLGYSLLFIPFVGSLVILAVMTRKSHEERWLATPRGDEDPEAAITLNLR